MDKLRSIDKRLITILLIVFVQIVGASMILPILPLYAKRSFDMSPSVITLLITAFFAAQFVAGPYLGRLSDRHGRVPVLIISQIGTAFSFLLLAIAPSVEILFLARILDGITGGNIIVAQAYVTDITKREERTQALGYIFAAFGIGFIIGPATGGILSAAFGARFPFVIAAIAASAIVVLTWRTLEETITPEKRAELAKQTKASLSPRVVMGNHPLMLILFVAFVGQFGFGLMQSTFALYGEAVLFKGASERTVSLGIGLLLANVGFGQLMTQLFVLRRSVKRFGDAKLVLSGSVLRAFSLFLYAVITTPWLAIFGGWAFALGTGIMIPASQALATRSADDDLRGGVLGLYQSAQSLAIIFGTGLAGILFEISPTTPYWIGGSLSVLTVIAAMPLLSRFKHQPPQPTLTFTIGQNVGEGTPVEPLRRETHETPAQP